MDSYRKNTLPVPFREEREKESDSRTTGFFFVQHLVTLTLLLNIAYRKKGHEIEHFLPLYGFLKNCFDLLIIYLIHDLIFVCSESKRTNNVRSY